MPKAAARNRAVFDSSALLPAICDWHEFHSRASAYLEGLFNIKSSIFVPEYVCVETYSVLTRLPPPYRMSAASAADLLDLNNNWFETIRLPDNRMLALLKSYAATGVAGGRIYDALHLEAARHARANEFVTFNAKHFEGLGGEIRIVTP